MRRGRIGRPSLIGTAARTAVIAGTATAVSGAVAGSMQKSAQQKAAAQQATAEAQQAQPAAPAEVEAAPVAEVPAGPHVGLSLRRPCLRIGQALEGRSLGRVALQANFHPVGRSAIRYTLFDTCHGSPLGNYERILEQA